MFKRKQLPVGTKSVGSPGYGVSEGSERSRNQTLILPKSWMLPNCWTISPAAQSASNWVIKLISASENWELTSFLEILVWVLNESHIKLRHWKIFYRLSKNDLVLFENLGNVWRHILSVKMDRKLDIGMKLAGVYATDSELFTSKEQTHTSNT